MSAKRKIEIFSAGCVACDETVAMVKRVACSSCDVQVLDIHDFAIAAKAKRYEIHRLPAVAVDGQLAGCCTATGPSEAELQAAGVGQLLP